MHIPVGFCQVNMKWTGAAIPLGAETTFGLMCASTAKPADIADLVNQTVISTQWTTGLSNQVAITSLLVKVGPNDTGPSGEFPIFVAGTAAESACPPNTAVLVKKGTLLGGRKAQGRMFLPGAAEVFVSPAGELDPQTLDNMQGHQEAFLDAFAASGHPMHLLHSSPNSGLAPLTVVSLSVQKIVATQRRRLRG